MPIISLNPRNSKDLPQPGFNEVGIPLCPNDPSLPMVYDGICREKGRADRIKYLCPKSKRVNINGKLQYVLSCENPCTPSKCGRIKTLLYIIITDLIPQCLEIVSSGKSYTNLELFVKDQFLKLKTLFKLKLLKLEILYL